MKTFLQALQSSTTNLIHSVPGHPSSMGRAWAQSRLAPLTELAEEVVYAGTVQYVGRSIYFSFVPARLDISRLDRIRWAMIKNDNAQPGLASEEQQGLTSFEVEFFEKILEVSAALQAFLPVSRPWAYSENGRELVFYSPTVGTFFGLTLSSLLKESLRHGNLHHVELCYPSGIVNSVGMGALFALRVYLGLDLLGAQIEELLPHRVFQIDEMTEGVPLELQRQIMIAPV